MINQLQLTTPPKMLRETAMNIEQLLRLQTVYSDCANATDRAVYEAATAVLRLECRAEPVIVALGNLATLFEAKAQKPDTDCAERYVAECWADYSPPAGVIFKGAL